MALVLSSTLNLHAGSIADRSTLGAILGPNSTTETFEELNQPPGTEGVFFGPFDVPGLSVFFPFNGFLNIYGAGNQGQPSIDVSGNGVGPGLDLLITFNSPVNAVGLDLLGFSGSPTPSSTQVTVLARDFSTVLYSSGSIAVSDPAAPFFFGYADPGEIGRLIVFGSGEPAIVDNITFGSAVPEVSTITMLGFGLLALSVGRFTRPR
jgi:hypothetical protein